MLMNNTACYKITYKDESYATVVKKFELNYV